MTKEEEEYRKKAANLVWTEWLYRLNNITINRERARRSSGSPSFPDQFCHEELWGVKAQGVNTGKSNVDLKHWVNVVDNESFLPVQNLLLFSNMERWGSVPLLKSWWLYPYSWTQRTYMQQKCVFSEFWGFPCLWSERHDGSESGGDPLGVCGRGSHWHFLLDYVAADEWRRGKKWRKKETKIWQSCVMFWLNWFGFE